MELKKRKLELELAATHKQLGMTSAAVVPPPHPVVVEPAKLMNPKELGMPTVMPVITKPVNIGNQSAFVPNQMPNSNVRTRIAPVNPALVNSMRSRDPRLARQTAQTIPPSLTIPITSINQHFPSKLLPSK